jgi:glucose-1-phosphate thymidylyltransferase
MDRYVCVNGKGVILLSGGPDDGARGRPGPAALRHVANRPILGHVLDSLRRAGLKDLVLVAPAAMAPEIRAFVEESPNGDSGISFLVHDDSPGPAGALHVAAELVGDDPCVLHFGDGLLTHPIALGKTLVPGGADLTVAVYPGTRSARLDHTGKRLLRIAEIDPEKTALGVAGMCAFGPGALREVAQSGVALREEIDLIRLAEELANRDGRVEAQVVSGWCRYTSGVTELLELNRIALDTSPALARATTDPGENDNQIEGRVFIDATARVTASVIFGPVIIGAGASVTEAYVGPYTSIGAYAHIEGVEIERSIISPGASITHLGGRLVESVVGTNARIFRDFSLPRAMRFRVGDGVEVALT